MPAVVGDDGDRSGDDASGRASKGGERNINSDIIAETFDAAGAYVMGRRMADGGEIPWAKNLH